MHKVIGSIHGRTVSLDIKELPNALYLEKIRDEVKHGSKIIMKN
ncbi:MAG: hypothetical protein WD052_13470 [Bacteroidales bacterium]